MTTRERVQQTAVRWGAVCLAAMVVVVAVQQAVWPLLLRLGTPEMVVRVARFAKEGLVAVVVVAAAVCLVGRRPPSRSASFVGVPRSRWDGVDAAVAVWVALVTAYLVVGVAAGGEVFPRTTNDPWLQLVGYRSLVVGPVLLVAVRSLPLRTEHRRWITTGVLVAGGILAAVAVFEVLAPSVMERFATDVLRLREYEARIFGLDLDYSVVRETSFDVGAGGVRVIRAGSLLFDYLQLGFFLVPASAIALVRVVDPARPDRARHAWLLALLGAGILATVTRTAIGALVVAVVVVVLTLPDEALRRRARIAGACVLALAAAVAIPTGVAARVGAGLVASDASSNEHVAALELGVRTIAANPMGLGIGSTAEVGPRSEAIALIVENAYLDVGVQTGLLGMAAIVMLLVAMIRALWGRLGEDPMAVPALATVVAFTVGSLLLHVWLMIEATWVAYMLAGIALRRAP